MPRCGCWPKSWPSNPRGALDRPAQAPSRARRSERRSATIAIDPQTQHATLAGRRSAASRATGFRTVSRTHGVAPDPYLSRYDRAEIFGRPRLKVVS